MASQRTHVRHIRQAQTQHRALRHETVDAIRSLHRSHMARLEPHLQHFTSAYASELRHVRADDDTAHVPLTWMRQQMGALSGPVRNVVRDFATQALSVTIGAKQRAAFQAQHDASVAIHKAVQRVPPEKHPPLHSYAAGDAGAIHQAVTTTGNGQPVAMLYDGIDDEADDEVGQAARTAALQGRDETWLRLALLAGLRISLNRALTIARNETLDCYRTVTVTVYVANNGILRGWVWQAHLGSCCMACALMHGSVHDIGEDMDEHVCGQCQMVPLAQGDDSENGDIETGYQWLQRQDEGVLRDKLGDAGYRAVKAGDVTLDQFLRVQQDSKWGNSIYQPSLRELGLDASDYVE